MKKLFTIAMISAAAIIAGSSCTPQSNEKIYSSLVSMVEGSYMTGNFYVVFDNGETAFVTNTSAITFKPTIDNEARAIIYYTIEEDQTKTGFDSVITISAVYGVSVDPVRDIYDHKLGEISDYKAEIDIMEALSLWYTIRKRITKAYFNRSTRTTDISTSSCTTIRTTTPKRTNTYLTYRIR